MSVIAHNLGAIGAGLGTTLVIALLAYAGALLAGTLIAVCRVSPIPPLRAVSTMWVTLACNIPTLCLMILLAFAAPRAGVHFSLFAAAVSAILFAGSGSCARRSARASTPSPRGRSRRPELWECLSGSLSAQSCFPRPWLAPSSRLSISSSPASSARLWLQPSGCASSPASPSSSICNPGRLFSCSCCRV